MPEPRDNVAGIMLRGGPCAEAGWTSHQHHFRPPFPSPIEVVKDRETGKIDVLDMADDAAKLTEDVFLYRIAREEGAFHVCGRGSGAGSGWYVWADYVGEAG